MGIARELSDLPGAVPRMYVVTRGAQRVLADDCVNLEQGGLRGLLRTIGAEHPHLRATQIDVDEQTGVEQLARQLLATSEEDETAWRDNEWYVARLCPTRCVLRSGAPSSRIISRAACACRSVPRRYATIELAAFHRVPPGPGQIEVAVRASSVNFADVLIAFGRYPSFEGHLPQLGTDFAGVVTAVGPGVTDHKVGDHVGGMSPNGCWGTFVTCDARLAATLPPGLGDAQAAAVTTAHATAWYGLHELARIRAGDTVLIHSGTGGVGQAAIAIARAAGAEIFATAGTPQRRELLRNMGIEHVYDSRSIEFAEQIRRDTNGRGVDVVLNSVTGAAQLAGLKLLAFRGRFVEIGKRDIYGDTKLGLFLPAQPVLLRRRPGVAVCDTPRRAARPARHGLSLDRSRRVADAAEHPLPPRRGGHRHPCDGQRRAHRQTRPPHPTDRKKPRYPASGTSSGVPSRRLLHHHRRPRWARAVPGREDGRGRLRPDRAEFPHPADAKDEGNDRGHRGDGL